MDYNYNYTWTNGVVKNVQRTCYQLISCFCGHFDKMSNFYFGNIFDEFLKMVDNHDSDTDEFYDEQDDINLLIS